MACVHDEHITYASTNQDFEPPITNTAYEERSPLLEAVETSSAIVHNNFENPVSKHKRLQRLNNALYTNFYNEHFHDPFIHKIQYKYIYIYIKFPYRSFDKSILKNRVN